MTYFHCNQMSTHPSYSRAAVRLVKSGYPSEAGAVIRMLDEGSNLFHLFGTNREHVSKYAALDEEGRATEYSVGKVRSYLEKSNEGVDLLADTYKYSSRTFSHFSTSSIIPNPDMSSSPWAAGDLEAHKIIVQVFLAVLGVSIFTILTETLLIIGHPGNDRVIQRIMADLEDALVKSPYLSN